MQLFFASPRSGFTLRVWAVIPRQHEKTDAPNHAFLGNDAHENIKKETMLAHIGLAAAGDRMGGKASGEQPVDKAAAFFITPDDMFSKVG